MNKKLLALAITAVAALPVSALAAGPTLYGQLDLSLENYDDSIDDVWTVETNASRVGIKGSAETAISGLEGIYKAEFGVDADDGGDPLTGRDIYVGVQGGFGTVLLGNMDTPTKKVQGKVDQFNDSTADMEFHVAGELRAPNIVAYASPKIADSLTVTVALWQGEGAAGPDGQPLTGVGDAISASVVYEQEGIYAGLGIDQETPVTGGVAVAGDNYNDIIRLVGGYAADAFEIGVMLQKAEGADTGSQNEDTTILVGGNLTAGDWKVKAEYAQTEGDNGAGDNTVTMFGVGADYALGKSTTAYGFVAKADDDVALDDQVISFGLRQKF